MLVVDDDPVSRNILKKTLTQWGHEVITAKDGKEAWAKLQSQDIRFVISDWMMPKIDGLELCRTIRGAQLPGYTYVILLTAKDEKKDCIEGLEAGADDFITKPFDPAELRVRIRAGLRVLELEDALEERNKNLRIAYLKMKKDLEAAAKMQQNLLPKSPPEAPNARLAWLLQPSSFVAGDIFNVFRLNEEHLGLYILDVSGHGVPAAMLSVTLSKLLSPLPGRDHLLKKFIPNPPHYELASCSEVAMKLNQSFQQETNDDMYFTMIYAKMNYHTGQLRWVQAGHPPPIHIPKGKKPRTIGEGGYPIGLIPDADYQEEKIDLKKGDRLFFYSDGVTETANERGELFSQERLCDLLKSLEEKPLTENPPAILKELKAWRGGKNDFEDDVTMILLEFDPK